ncbi:MAG TPA: type II toxin-antitoxin system RelE/ParE family toxin [Candidatus Nanoarchaeia archaeon]|nr:type II toxin-antitoxin system RelE/ParE family toxin [Candidatus Nanoarchaeia archaeon]
MADWTVQRTDTFLKQLKGLRNNHELLREIDKKIKRLLENPEAIGGFLSGPLHGKRSTRLYSSFRLIFQIDQTTSTVYLVAIDHRGNVYKQDR